MCSAILLYRGTDRCVHPFQVTKTMQVGGAKRETGNATSVFYVLRNNTGESGLHCVLSLYKSCKTVVQLAKRQVRESDRWSRGERKNAFKHKRGHSECVTSVAIVQDVIASGGYDKS